MKLKYDSKVDAVYIKFSEGKYTRTRKVTDTFLVDEDKDGRILGMEILDASKTIPEFDPKKKDFRFQIV